MVLNTLHDKMEISYKDLLMIYMNRNYVLKIPVSELNLTHMDQFLKYSDIYLKVKVMKHILLDTIKRRQNLLINSTQTVLNF